MGKMLEQIKKATEATDAAIAALKAGAEKGKATNKGATIAGLAATPDVKVSGNVPGAETDLYQGKGLGFARAARIKAFAAREMIPEEKAFELFKQRAPSTGINHEAVKRSMGLIDEERFAKGFAGTVQSFDGTVERALGESTFAGGGVFVPDELSAEFIDILRAEVALLKMPIEKIPMARETLTFARESSATAPAWVGENSAVTYSDPQFDAPQLQLKKLGAQTALSNDLLRDASIAPDIILRNDLVKQATLALDIALIRNLGTSFSPKGIRYIMPAGNVVGSNAGSGTPTLTNALYDINKLKSLLDTQNVPDMKRFLLGNPRTFLGMDLLRDGVGGTPLGAEMAALKTLRGLPFAKTTQIPVNLSGGGSGGSSESELYIGEGTEIIVGEGLQPTVEVVRFGTWVDANSNVQSGLAKDQTVIAIFLRYDIIQKHSVSTACINGCTYGA